MYNLYGGVYNRNINSYSNEFSTQIYDYWYRSFYQRAVTLFEFKNLPKNWDKDAFQYALYHLGFLVGFESKKYGLVIQYGTPTGYGLQYQPTGMQINSPYFNFPKPLKIGVDCEVIKLTPDYRGITDIISKYADEMRLVDIAIRQSEINSRFAYAFVAPDDKTKRTMETISQQLANGKPAIVVNKNLKVDPVTNETGEPWAQFDRDLKKNFILPDLLEARRTTVRDFYRELGVRMSEEKKERLITDEIEQQETETYIRREVWHGCLEESLRKFNELFKTNITVKVNEPKIKVGDEDVNE